MLQTTLPVGRRFPDWRSGNEAELRNRMSMPAEGVCFDVKHNGFWLPEWGPRPADPAVALGRCRELLATAPTLVPVYAQRTDPRTLE